MVMKYDYPDDASRRIAEQVRASRLANAPSNAEQGPSVAAESKLKEWVIDRDAPRLTQTQLKTYADRWAQAFGADGKARWAGPTHDSLRADMNNFRDLVSSLAVHHPDVNSANLYPPKSVDLKDFGPYLERAQRWFNEHPNAL